MSAPNERPPSHKSPSSEKCHICNDWYTNLSEHFRHMHSESFICPYCNEINKGKPKHYSLAEFNVHLTQPPHTEKQIYDYIENLNKTLSVLQTAQAKAAERAGAKAAARAASRAAAESSKREAAAKAANRNEAKNAAKSLLELTQIAWREYEAAMILVDLREHRAADVLVGMKRHSTMNENEENENENEENENEENENEENENKVAFKKAKRGGKRCRTMNKNYKKRGYRRSHKKTRRSRKTRRAHKKSKSRRY